MKYVYSLGLNLNTKFLSKSAGSGGSGRGDARYTAFSIDWRGAASPLHWGTRAPLTSPPGILGNSTKQSRPTLAHGGVIHAFWLLLRSRGLYVSRQGPGSTALR